MRASLLKPAGVLALATAALPALAHEGHVHEGLVAGLAHPLGGADHLLATLGVGLVAGLLGARPGHANGADGGRRVGLAALLGLLAGGAWAFLAGRVPGLPAPGPSLVEATAALGLLVIALALLRIERLGARGLAALALAVALPHGWLHATEAAGGPFLAGLALSSVALFAAGLALGHAGSRLAAPRVERARWLAAAGYAGAFGWLATAALR